MEKITNEDIQQVNYKNLVKNAEEFEKFFGESIDSSVVEEETDDEEGFNEWLNELKESDNPQEKIFQKLQEFVSEDDMKCMTMILDYLNQGHKLDIVGLEDMLRPSFPEINSIEVFQYVMLLTGAGFIKEE